MIAPRLAYLESQNLRISSSKYVNGPTAVAGSRGFVIPLFKTPFRSRKPAEHPRAPQLQKTSFTPKTWWRFQWYDCISTVYDSKTRIIILYSNIRFIPYSHACSMIRFRCTKANPLGTPLPMHGRHLPLGPLSWWQDVHYMCSFTCICLLAADTGRYDDTNIKWS